MIMAHSRQAQAELSKRRTYRVAEAGFSLVELAIAVVIIGVMMTMGLAAMNAARQNQAFSSTAAKEVSIRNALINYLRSYKRLPCPDTDFTAPDGLENRVTPGDPTTACSAPFGILPYVTLGLSKDAVQDGWSNFFSYRVSNTTGSNLDWTRTASFNTGNTGVITINNRVSGTITPIATNVVAVIVSHGPNGYGAYTTGGTRNLPIPATSIDETTNTNGGTTYYKRDGTTDDTVTGGAIDDIVLFITANDLLGPLYLDGSLQSPAAIVNAELQKIKLAIVGYAMGQSSNWGKSNCGSWGSTPRCRLLPYADTSGPPNGTPNPGSLTGGVPYSPIGLTLSDVTDPWGSYLVYVVNSSAASIGIGSSTSSSTTAMTITSYGPDRAAGGGDDITLTVSVGELQGLMSNFLP